MMKRFLALMAVWAVSTVALCAQTLTVTVMDKDSLGEKTMASLEQRIGQILKANGCKEASEGTPLEIAVKVTDMMETPTDPVQTAVSADIIFTSGEASYTVSVRGVGDNQDDALSRAILQLSPASKATRSFMDEVKKQP